MVHYFFVREQHVVVRPQLKENEFWEWMGWIGFFLLLAYVTSA